MQTNNKITIIVPIYKVENYINKCVDSILAQTHQNLEIILVDDGSPDRCPKICDDYCRRDKRVRCIHKKNGGLSDARNAGLDVATGDYIMFVDGDDYIVSNMIEKMHSALVEADADISICNFCYVDPDGKYDYAEENKNLPVRDEVIQAGDVLKIKLKEDKSWYWVIACCKLYKKSIFDGLRFIVGKLHEDEFLLHEVFLNAGKVACLSDKFYFYQQRKDSIMGNRVNCRRLDSVEALLTRCDALMAVSGFEQAAVFSLLAAASAFHGYYCSSHAHLDKMHKTRNKELQKEFRVMFRKMIHRRLPLSGHDFIKIGVNYISLYYSGKFVHHY